MNLKKSMNYDESISILTSKKIFHIKLGLERITELLNKIGRPQDKTKILHIAGTNGKGSVSAVLSNILTQSGCKTGLYTSPHLIDYTERIRIDGVQISKDDFSALIEYIAGACEKYNIYLTEFEILTAAAYKYFAESGADFAVIETGLGGRFDASNVCAHPIAAIITSISLDHMDRLGNTIEQIAFEKAGIIKPGAPVIVSSDNKGFKVIKEQADTAGSEVITAGGRISIVYENGVNYALMGGKKYKFPLLGLYQGENLALVYETCRYLSRLGCKINLEKGLETAQWRARFQYIKEKNILIDGAHNPDGALKLKQSLDYYFQNQKKIFIYGVINTKDYRKTAEIFFNKETEIYYYEFEHKDAVSYMEYKQALPELNVQKFNSGVLSRKELKIVFGSLYMAGYFMKKFNV